MNERGKQLIRMIYKELMISPTACALFCITMVFCNLIARAQILTLVQIWYGNVSRPFLHPFTPKYDGRTAEKVWV